MLYLKGACNINFYIHKNKFKSNNLINKKEDIYKKFIVKMNIIFLK
jgi:hypothetical protein